MDILDIIFTCTFAFASSFLFIKVTKPIAKSLGLIDKPNERKQHNGDIPLVGGIAIFFSVLTVSLLFLPHSLELKAYLIASSLMVFIGAIDDKYDISVRIRIVGQLLIASIMIYGVDVYITNLGDVFVVGNINLSWLGVPFTYLAVLGAINAFNMVDGIDGLVGSLSITTFLSIATLLLLAGNVESIIYPLILAICVLPYLMFNLSKPSKRLKKVFMGDAGSMFIGLTVVWLLAKFTQGDSAAFRPVTALWVIAVPLIDMIAIIFRRIKKGQSPFKPDRDHLHHIFMRIGFSDRQALMIITIIACAFSLIGIWGELFNVPESVMFMFFVIVTIAFSYAIQHIWVLLKLLKVKMPNLQESNS